MVYRVARSVAGALGVSLTPAEQRARRTAPTGNQQGDELYVRGKVRIRHETRADDSVAIALLERAVALDPGFAVAHAALAHAYAMRVKQFAPDDSAARELAFVSVERALRLNPDLAEAHSVTAGLAWDASKQFAPGRAREQD